MNWYVFFVRTSKEQKVKQLFDQWMDRDLCKPFVPLQERLFKVAGTVKKEYSPLLPSYVFVESRLSSSEFMSTTNQVISRSQDVLYLLRYSDTEASMKEEERRVLESLCNSEYCIESSSGIIEGDNIHITDGPLKGLGSIVKKINRHKRQALIELEIMGDVRYIDVALEIVRKS